MKRITIIKKIKANFIRFKAHRFLSFSADFLIFLGYLIKLSAWVEHNCKRLSYNDFYNRKVLHRERIKLYEHILVEKKLEHQEIVYLEFGVANGNSLRWWTSQNKNTSSTFWGFDTFTGLPERYGSYDPGTFTMNGDFPDIQDNRINFVKGMFQDTLLTKVSSVDFSVPLVLHLDADLYTSTLYVMCVLYPYLKAGDLIIFDEFGVPGHEFKAFDDFVRSFPLDLKPMGAINNYLQMIFEVQ